MDQIVAEQNQGFPLVEDLSHGRVHQWGMIFPDGTRVINGIAHRSSDPIRLQKDRLLYLQMKEREIRRLMGEWGALINSCEESPGCRDFDGSKRANAREHVKRLEDELAKTQKQMQGFSNSNTFSTFTGGQDL